MLKSRGAVTGGISPEDWGDWRYHMKHLIRSVAELERWIELSDAERAGIAATEGHYKWMLTPYYASLMRPTDDACPIRRQSIPHVSEGKAVFNADVDPVGDRKYSKTRRVVHKYPNRIILLVSDTCPVYCRHCTRKFHTTSTSGTYYNEEFSLSYEPDFAYIRAHPEISDVLLTGGDPLVLTDGKLEAIVRELRAIPHVKVVRIGSRYPVFLPQRITPELCEMLAKYHPVWLSTHFNHPVEVTDEAAAAVDRLLRHGVPVQNQTVLLKGVNDDLEVIRTLNRRLLEIRVRPYYLYHADNVTGVSHFRTTVAKGLEIMEGLVGFETGFSVPTYVITTELGKIPVNNEYYQRDGKRHLVRNYRGERADITRYLALDSEEIGLA
jgi:lysine 2,3-aminomutase